MKQGIVMKVYKNYSVVLSEKNYYRVNNKADMKQGQIILFSNEDLYKQKEQRSGMMKKFRTVAAVAAALLIMVSAGVFMNQDEVVSYVMVDINPSVQLEVDSNELVIGYSALNDDATTLELDYVIGLSIEEAVEYIATQAEEAGFLDTEDLTDDFVLITTVSEEDGEDIKELLEALKETSEVLMGVNVAVIDATKEEMDAAIEHNLPVGLVAAEDGSTDLENYTVKEYFKDENNRAAFEEKGDILPEDFGHEVERINLNLMNAEMDEELKSEIMEELEAEREAYELALDDLASAREAYNEALELEDEEAIAAAELALETAESAVETLRDEKEEILEQISEQVRENVRERQELAEDREDENGAGVKDGVDEGEKIQNEERIEGQEGQEDRDDREQGNPEAGIEQEPGEGQRPEAGPEEGVEPGVESGGGPGSQPGAEPGPGPGPEPEEEPEEDEGE